MSRLASSYFIALLAVLSASEVAALSASQVARSSIGAVIDAEANAEQASVIVRKERPTATQNLAVDSDGGIHSEEKVVMLNINGMTCANCASSVETALTNVPGVQSASVSYEDGKGLVHFDPNIATTAAMVDAVNKIGMGVAQPEALLQLNGEADRSGEVVKQIDGEADLDGEADRWKSRSMVMLRVDGMKCHKCSAAVESALSGVHGVRGASVSHTTHVGQVQFHPHVVSTDAILDAVKGIGFGASLLQEGEHLTQKQESLLQLNGEEEAAILSIDGMMCGKCATKVERALSGVPGVLGASVSHTTHKGHVQFYRSVASTDAIVDAVKDLGFGASVL